MLNADQITALERAMAEEHKRDIEALERLKRFIKPSSNGHKPDMSLHDRVKAAANTEARTQLALSNGEDDVSGEQPSTIIGKVVELLNRDVAKGWTVSGVVAQMKAEGFQLNAKKPDATVGLVFQKLVKREIARITHRGAGRDPHVYKAVPKEDAK